MEELIRMLGFLAENIGGDWKDKVLIDNTNDNPMVDAYNEGVRAMASQCCGLITAILTGKQIELKQKGFGTILELKKEGEE